MNDKLQKLDKELTLAQQRRALFNNKSVIAVMLTTDGKWTRVVAGSFTDEPDPTVKGVGGQVSFLTREGLSTYESSNLVLTYVHFIAALKYTTPREEFTK